MNMDKKDLEVLAETGKAISRVRGSWWFGWFANKQDKKAFTLANNDLSFVYYRHHGNNKFGDEVEQLK